MSKFGMGFFCEEYPCMTTIVNIKPKDRTMSEVPNDRLRKSGRIALISRDMASDVNAAAFSIPSFVRSAAKISWEAKRFAIRTPIPIPSNLAGVNRHTSRFVPKTIASLKKGETIIINVVR